MNHPDPRTALHHAQSWLTSSHTGQGQIDDSAAGGTGALTVTRAPQPPFGSE